MKISNTQQTGPVQIPLKGLSVNEAYTGKRYKTDKYRNFERSALFILPKLTLPEPPYCIHLEFGLTNIASDFDNPIKPFVDVLQKKYKFNDKLINKGIIEKIPVKEGQEYIKFEITHHGN